MNKEQLKQITELAEEKSQLLQRHASRIFLQFANEFMKIKGDELDGAEYVPTE